MSISPADALIISRSIRIPTSEFEIEMTRSSGPGGQNVNKVSSKVRLRWPVAQSTSIPDDVRQRLLAAQAGRVTTEGELIVTSQRFRDQRRNRQDCFERLRGMILEVLRPPKPRRETKPTRGSQKRRLDAKRRRSVTKRLRGKPPAGD